MQDYACFDNLATHDQLARLLLQGACVVKGSGKNAGAVKSSPIFGVPLAWICSQFQVDG
jgi:hypothetical protein